MSSSEVGMDDAVSVHDLVVDRGGRRVLQGISCAVPRGTVTGLLGPSGSGKTTLMRAMFHAMAAAGTTLLVSSHVMDEAARCDRLLLIRDGRLVADDTPDTVRA